MSKHLVIVESPAKAKTIQKYLGNDYDVLASYGHVRDLPARKGSVNPEEHFSMTYVPIEKNARHIDTIAKTLKKSDSLLLATDPDREGEAISWHIFELMKERNLLKDKSVHRIFFNEITKAAIQDAINHPRSISMDLVNAQQARRALDYLVGFNLSPLLWKKIRRGLSAGRVQSPALRLIVEREEEIERFIAQEYWKIIAKCAHASTEFEARLTHYDNEKLQQFSVTQREQAHEIKKQLIAQAQGFLTVTQIDKKQRKRKPSPPFITSTLQQEAARKLGFTARKTMMVAQQLYEGIDIGTGTVGLITYMRTDSVNLAKEAIDEIRDYITHRYKADNCPSSPRIYKTKSKNAQEAHEAIRPTSIKRTPEMVQGSLTSDQFKLYNLIWKRTVASQMADAILDTVSVDFSCGKGNIFRANGSTVAFPGFLSVYEEGRDDSKDEDNEDKILPAFNVGEKIKVLDIETNQHFTEPPPRYSEATLVKALEEYDIGRPSTYASIIHTLQQREYVVVEKKRFLPTDVGRIVNRFLTNYFTRYVDYQFTAGLEDTLDAIARGEKDWIPVLEEFWQPFVQQIQNIDEQVQRKDVTTELLDEKCPKCQKPLSIRLGKRGRFIGCTGYPDCDYTQDISNPEGEKAEPEVVEGRACPLCHGALHIKTGRYGKFIGCSNYPECKHMEPLEKPSDTGVTCPKCNQAKILQRKSRKGKIFYSCGNYPKCDYALWNEPVDLPCPKCAWPILTLKESKKFGRQILCPREGCDYSAKED
ncbi:TPA: type I DNA topoisomerase [Legionella pneumophila]|uniref:type I DNA topoisomerase n=1 Tax=Legionella pneumophila TaxID=446 RepID=UPI000789859B|nr:type I DNA topoisomerase [Legionella pneumophila]MDW8879389.1 type I DNA topoisomerase [Legionella pneumophila subsp. fraseri]MDW8961868.1 type I DNA topoisomerase [Legionella pneumophila subsp. fraseri]MDW9035591.1 type I DNA topoisomerase [Legionella pneumophila subsp. fraseri]MDW9039212.1 type I DNA topoisomerase [Legionella pneumophila subsp. fraseri]MDW9042060.1 type I DNA topoisomerase [Legionella pneumophila subsp. fraseri]